VNLAVVLGQLKVEEDLLELQEESARRPM